MALFSRAALVGAGVALLALTLAAHAFELRTSADVVSASSCSSGVIGVWVWNTFPNAQVYFNAESGIANAYFDKPYQSAGSSGAAEASLVLTPPACMQGSFDEGISVQVCDQGGCSTQSTTVRVESFPCATDRCNAVQPMVAFPPVTPSPQPYAMCGNVPCYEVTSTVIRQANYLPTYYNAVLQRDNAMQCLQYSCSQDQVQAGGSVDIRLKAINEGAPGSFDVNGVSAQEGLNVLPNDAAFDLAQSASTDFDFHVYASPSTPAGTYRVTFRISHNGVVLNSLDQFVEVVGAPSPAPAPSGAARLTFPPSVVVDECSAPAQVAFPATLQNLDGAQTFQVVANLNGNNVFSTTVPVGSGSSQNFPIVIDTNKFSLGQNVVSIYASSPSVQGSGQMQVTVVAQKGASFTKDADNLTGVGNHIVITATVDNNGDCWLQNVTGVLTGIPSSWQYSSAVIEVPPHGEANLTLNVLATTGDVVSPVLTIRSGDKVISTRQLGPINTGNASLTGFVTLGSTELFIAIIAAMAVLAALLFFAASNNNYDAVARYDRNKARAASSQPG